MSTSKRFENWGFVDALDADSEPALRKLGERMAAFYEGPSVHDYWVYSDHINNLWLPDKAPYHCHLRNQMQSGERVIDFGCGGTHAWRNLRSVGITYTGIEWARQQAALNQQQEPDATYLAGNFLEDDLGLEGSADWAISLFALEHCSSPHVMLQRMAKSVRPGGRVAILCPDFTSGMPSLRSGLSAMTRREKLRRLRFLDLFCGLLQDKLIWPRATISYILA